MKKLLIFVLCVCFLAGCTPARPTESTSETTVPATTVTVPSTPPPTTVLPTTTQIVPTAPAVFPDTVGIYIPAADGTAARKRVTEFSSRWTAKKDIDCFEILASREAVVKGASFASIWKAAWNAHPDTENAKIGFHIHLALQSGETISQQLLKPSDGAGFYEYLEIYMYDDVHVAPGVWYTHLEDKDMKPETVITSIKLTSGSKISQVENIYLTAFIYNSQECFADSGNYLGTVLETITIRNSGS